MMKIRRFCPHGSGPWLRAFLGILIASAITTVAATAQSTELPPQPPCPSLSLQIPTSSPVLELDKPIVHTVKKAGSDAYCIMLSAGQHAAIDLNPKGVRLKVQLLNARQAMIVEWDAPQKLDIVSDSGAPYLLKVQPEYTNHPATPYELRLTDIHSASDQERLLFKAHEYSTLLKLSYQSGKFDDAVKNGKEAIHLAEQAEKSGNADVAQLLQELGNIQLTTRDLTSAGKNLERASQIIQQTKGDWNSQKALVLNDLGRLYTEKEDFGKAESLLQEALDISRKLYGDDHPQTAMCILNLAIMRQRRGEYHAALTAMQQALAIDEKAFGLDDLTVLELRDRYADVYIDLEDYAAAKPILEETLARTEKKLGPSHPLLAHQLQNLGITARHQREFSKALEYFWRSEKIREQIYGLHNSVTGTVFVNIGNVYDEEGDYPHALEAFQRGLNILEETEGPYHEWVLVTLGNIARVYARQGNISHALEYLSRENEGMERAISFNLIAGSEQDRLALVDKYSHIPSRIITLNIRNAPADREARDLAALVVLERKGRVQDALSDTMSALRGHLQPEDQALLEQLSATTASLAKVSLSGAVQLSTDERWRQITSLERQREKLEVEISRRSKGYYATSSSVTLDAVKAAIPDNCVLVEIAIYTPYDISGSGKAVDGNPSYVAYLISRNREVISKELGSKQEIDGAVRNFQQALQNPRRTDIKKLSRSLDQRIFQPIRALSKGTRHWIISPDGQLNFLPFESLVDEQGQFLVENHSISYVTTGRDLLRMQAAPPSKSPPILVANPLFGETPEKEAVLNKPRLTYVAALNRRRSITTGDTMSDIYFAPLNGTEQEVKQLHSLFPNALVLSGSRASKAELQQANAPEILHIATHGFFLNNARSTDRSNNAPPASGTTRAIQASIKIENPLLRSGLALAGANLEKDSGDNGILTALEASSLNLWGTKLVTLSACDTGLGEVKSGEGVYGLRRAFVLAGAQSIVTSLWPVSDYATRKLMTDYYTGLKNGQGRGEALRQAQLAMLKRKGHEHPFYWASFILFGNWTSLNNK